MNKKNMFLVMTAVFTLSCAFVSHAEWGQDESGHWYKNDSGSYASDQVMEIDGATYAFGREGYMLTGWQTFDAKWYYFDTQSGAKKNGWTQLGDHWYYLNPSAGGAMHTSWLKIGSKTYYMDENGVMKTGYFGVDGLAYRADDAGVLYRNKVEPDGNGNAYVYDDQGRIKFVNDYTRTISRGDGGSVYQDFLPPEYFEEGKNQIIQHAGWVVDNKKDELFVKYKKRVDTAKTARSREIRLKTWETGVTRELSNLNVTQEEINAYIQKVKTNSYIPYGDLSEFDYEYEYEEQDYDDYGSGYEYGY